MAREWKVPGYTELRRIGSGGFGDVVLARQDFSGSLVAVKYLRRELLDEPGFAEMFRAEAGVLALLDDPNVVRLYEYVESPAGAAIVMELVDGVSVRDILSRQGATSARRRWWCCRGRCWAWPRRTRGGWCTGITSRRMSWSTGRGQQAHRFRDRGAGRGPAGPGRDAGLRAAGAVHRGPGQPGRGRLRRHGHLL